MRVVKPTRDERRNVIERMRNLKRRVQAVCARMEGRKSVSTFVTLPPSREGEVVGARALRVVHMREQDPAGWKRVQGLERGLRMAAPNFNSRDSRARHVGGIHIRQGKDSCQLRQGNQAPKLLDSKYS